MDLEKAMDEALGTGLRDGREKIKLDDLIRQYPDGVTINGFEMCSGKKGDFPVFAMLEAPKYFSGGGDLRLLSDKWLATAEGDITLINESLAQKPVKVKIWKVQTNSGNTYTKVSRIRKEQTTP